MATNRQQYKKIDQPSRTTLLQPRLTIGQVDDPYEREADRVAEQVMRMPAPIVQRAPAHIQRAADGATPEVTPETEGQIEALRGGGQQLDGEVRRFMEPRFGYDFGSVRVHTGPQAARAASGVNALAFTLGNDVVFGAGQYQPGSAAGQRLIAHELTHVVQQTPKAVIQRKRRISTPLPEGASLQRDGSANIEIAQIRVRILPDRRTSNRNMTGRAETKARLRWGTPGCRFGRDGSVSRINPMPPITMQIQTTYGPGVTAQSNSAYGRGTTEADIQAGNTSLGFHEGNHGLDLMGYLSNNPLPIFTGSVGMTSEEYNQAQQQFNEEMQAYQDAMDAYSEQQTDCVGHSADFCPSP